MATFSKSLKLLSPSRDYICTRCLQFSTSPLAASGHSRWSKIKHDKAVVDGKKNVQRSMLSREITLCSKLHGGDPKTNFKLAAILANAKKAGFPKESMERAIARGQGKSTSGATLERINFEVIMPVSVAMIIEVETDNKNRTHMELRDLIKRHGGVVTPTAYLFSKKGRISFSSDERNLSVDEVLDDAIEAGAEDVEVDDDGNIVVTTEPNMTSSAAEALKDSLGLKVESLDIIWDANRDTKVSIDGEAVVRGLQEFLETLQDHSEVQGIYANLEQGVLNDELWEGLQNGLDS